MLETDGKRALTLGIWAAAIAAIGNIFVSLFNHRHEQSLESSRFEQQQFVEKHRTEAQRILTAIDVGDPAQAASNLRFLLKAGLVREEDTLRGLIDYLGETPPASVAFTGSGDSAAESEGHLSGPDAQEAAITPSEVSELRSRYGVQDTPDRPIITYKYLKQGGI